MSREDRNVARQVNWPIMCHNFDVMHWWETTGKVLHPHVYPVACCILAMADSNGSQERTFSAATWMDGRLKTRQSDFTFQSKVTLYKNQGFLADHAKFLENDLSREAIERAEARTKKLINRALDACSDSDLDEEANDEFDACTNAGSTD